MDDDWVEVEEGCDNPLDALDALLHDLDDITTYEDDGYEVVTDGYGFLDEDDFPEEIAPVVSYDNQQSPAQPQIKISTTVTALKNLTIQLKGTPLTSTIGASVVLDILRIVNLHWNPASILFELKNYKEINMPPNLTYTEDNYIDFYHEALNSEDTMDGDAQINIYFVPYLNNNVLGSSWAYEGAGGKNKNYIIMSENDPTLKTKVQNAESAGTLAHELGHALELEHHEDRNNLMYPVEIVGSALSLDANQIKSTRAVAMLQKTPNQLTSKRSMATRSMATRSGKLIIVDEYKKET